MTSEPSGSKAFDLLDERIRRWIWDQQWPELRRGQELAIPAILTHQNDVILAAPTSSGKTEAAFFPILTRILFTPQPSVRVLYISPLKALINDQFGRLDSLCELLNVPVHRWHGDVDQNAKDRLLKQPCGILLITPESMESLFVNYGSNLLRVFAHLDYVVVDELHSFIGSERGAQLRSLLCRLEDILGRSVVRVGLSATLSDMGLAAEFLRWEAPASVKLITTDGGGELKAQIRGCLKPRPTNDEDRDALTADEQIVNHIFEKMRDGHHLIFANARNRVEAYADALHELARLHGVPDVFLAHHGNLSKELREDAENRLRSRERSAICVCTSTLELGIDIGAMSSVAQVGPPPSVASLRQRVGRSGRRGGAAVLRMYAEEDEILPVDKPTDRLRLTLVQEMAALQLMISKWCEPPDPRQPHYSTLVQQILSVIIEKAGITIPEIFRLLCSVGAFQSVDKPAFVELLRSLKSKDLIQQMDDGVLLLSKKGERITAHYSFYAAFATSEEFRILHGSRTLGTMPVDSVLRPNDNIVFGGQRWRVIDVNDEQRVILVEPSSGGKAPMFGGEGGRVHSQVRQTMRRILSDREGSYPFLDSIATKLLKEAQNNYKSMGLESESLMPVGEYTHCFHWRGDREALTLALLLSDRGLQSQMSNVALAVNAPLGRVRQALQEIIAETPPKADDLADTIKTKRANKYDWALPDKLLDHEFAVRELDVPGAIEIADALLANLKATPIRKDLVQQSSTYQSELRILAGAETIGGTKILLSQGGEDLLLDFGLDFHQYGRFFEEFLRPRSTRGLLDLWHFNLIPHLSNAYREDLQPLGERFETSDRVNLCGILLSHAHVDHFGMIGTIRADVPIHASPVSLAIIKASQDSGRLDFWGEAVYLKERGAGDKDARALKVQDACTGRECIAIGNLTAELTAFCQSLPSEEGSRNLQSGRIATSNGRLGPFLYRGWEVDHSLPGCMAFLIETDLGAIAYTGDLRFHGRKGNVTRAFVSDLAALQPDLLICEGTQLSREIPNATTEDEVSETALNIVREAAGRLVIADFGPRHVERLVSFLEIADETQRRLVITTKDAYLLRALAAADPSFNPLSSMKLSIYDEIRAGISKWEAAIKDEFRDILVNSREIRDHQGWYILAFSFFDCNELIDVMPENAVYIYSGSEAYSEDQTQDMRRLWEWCHEFNMTVHGFAIEDKKPTFPDSLNASGHATPDDLRWLIETVRPKALLPVHRSPGTDGWFETVCHDFNINLLTANKNDGRVRI